MMVEKLDDVERKIRKIISLILQLDEPEILPDSTIEELGGDSLNVLSIVSELEQQYSIKISDEQLGDIRSFKDMVKVVKGNKSNTSEMMGR